MSEELDEDTYRKVVNYVFSLPVPHDMETCDIPVGTLSELPNHGSAVQSIFEISQENLATEEDGPSESRLLYLQARRNLSRSRSPQSLPLTHRYDRNRRYPRRRRRRTRAIDSYRPVHSPDFDRYRVRLWEDYRGTNRQPYEYHQTDRYQHQTESVRNYRQQGYDRSDNARYARFHQGDYPHYSDVRPSGYLGEYQDPYPLQCQWLIAPDLEPPSPRRADHDPDEVDRPSAYLGGCRNPYRLQSQWPNGPVPVPPSPRRASHDPNEVGRPSTYFRGCRDPYLRRVGGL